MISACFYYKNVYLNRLLWCDAIIILQQYDVINTYGFIFSIINY